MPLPQHHPGVNLQGFERRKSALPDAVWHLAEVRSIVGWDPDDPGTQVGISQAESTVEKSSPTALQFVGGTTISAVSSRTLPRYWSCGVSKVFFSMILLGLGSDPCQHDDLVSGTMEEVSMGRRPSRV